MGEKEREEFGLAITRLVCIADKCLRYALTKKGLWVQAPWALNVTARPYGAFLTGQPLRVNGVDVTIDELIAVVQLKDVLREGMGEAVLARLTKKEAVTVTKVLLMALGMSRKEVEREAREAGEEEV